MCRVLLIHPQLHFLNALHPYHPHYDAIELAARERGFVTVRAIGPPPGVWMELARPCAWIDFTNRNEGDCPIVNPAAAAPMANKAADPVARCSNRSLMLPLQGS
jgi:hypothetical protein